MGMKFALTLFALLLCSAVVEAEDTKTTISVYVSFETYCWKNGYGQDKGCSRELDRCAIFVGLSPKDMSDKIKVSKCPDAPIQNSCTGRTDFADVYYYRTSGQVNRGSEWESCLATGGSWHTF